MITFIQKPTVLFIILFVFTVPSLAQLNAPIGFNFTYEGDRIDGYLGTDYHSQTDFEIVKVRSMDYYEGHYITSEGAKQFGYIKYDPTNNYFHFKKQHEDKGEKIKPNDCQSFILLQDTFKVFTDFELQGKLLSYTKSTPRFLMNLKSFNGFNFYKYTTYNNKVVDYYFYQEPSHSYELVNFPKQGDKFKEIAAHVFRKAPWISAAIAEGKYMEEDILQLIMLYRYELAIQNHQKIFLNNKLEEVNSAIDATYYLIVERLDAEAQRIKYYDLLGNLQHTGTYTSIYPFIEGGKNTWYHENGNKRKEKDFQAGKLIGTNYYDLDEKLIFVSEQDPSNNERFIEVFNKAGEDLLKSGGIQSFTMDDPIRKKALKFTFEQNELKSLSYVDDNNQKIYLKAEKDLKLKGTKFAASDLEEACKYPETALKKGTDGTIYLSCKVDKKGKPFDLSVLYGINSELNQAVLSQFIAFTDYIKWKPAKQGKEKVIAEVIIPITLIIRSNNPILNYNNNWMFMHNQMMMHNINHVTPPPMPRASFGY